MGDSIRNLILNLMEIKRQSLAQKYLSVHGIIAYWCMMGQEECSM